MVFNGNKEEDEDGEFTYVGEKGASVVDYAKVRSGSVQMRMDRKGQKVSGSETG